MASSPEMGIKLRHDELLFLAACVCNFWCVCLCVCVCVEGGRGMRSSWRWQFSRAMRLLLRWFRLCPRRGVGGASKPKRKLQELWSYFKLLLKSLYFNSLSNSDTLLDCVFEPVYWIVDHVTRWFGVVSGLDLFRLELIVLFTSKNRFLQQALASKLAVPSLS